MACSTQTMAGPQQAKFTSGAAENRTMQRRAVAPASAGNQAHLRRLTIGAVNDPLEREADATADKVMRMADPQITRSSAPVVSRKCAACEEEEGLKRAATAGGMDGAVAPPVVDAVLGSPGRALDPATQDFMGSRFGTDFGHVRIHTDSQAAQSAAAVNARAYTVGSNLVFGAGQYNPGSDAGRRLLAHELTHVIQQSGGATTIQRDLATSPPDVAPEAQNDLTPAQIQEAIRYNTGFYDDANTRLIQSILGGGVTGKWTADNIRAIAATQGEYGLKKDGKVGKDTFDFIASEQDAEAATTDTANCLISFRVVNNPVLHDETPGPGGRTRIQGHHVVEARFSSRCDCSQFEYRQFISGVGTATGATGTQNLNAQFNLIPGGVLPVTMAEDGITACISRNYGHRDQPGLATGTVKCPVDHYSDDDGTANQAGGCVYRGEDDPKLTINGLHTGDSIDLLVKFRGEIRRAGVVVATRTWTDIDTTIVTP